MATYKVIQDIEAEDKLLGPLTMRQFIYAIIVAVSGFIAFRLVLVNWLLALPLLPIILFFGLLAAPFGHDQSSEVWLLAKIRFMLKPRRRIWNQSGIKELVTITAPKKIEHALTNNLTQTEVRSRLQALANTIDSRGWSVKNVNVNLFSEPSYVAAKTSDRLLDATELPQEVSNADITAGDDMLDERNNPTAQHLDQMMVASSQAHRQQAVAQMQQTAQPGATQSQGAPADYWFMSQNPASPAPGMATIKPGVVAPGQASHKTSTHSNPDEEELSKKLHAKHGRSSPAYGHMRTLKPLGDKKLPATTGSHVTTKSEADKGDAASPTAPDPAIISLANNDDLNVATIARQAEKNRRKEPPADDEVVISLH